jgi:hypothetical protein
MPFIIKELLFAAGAVALSLLFIVQSFRLTDSAALVPRLMAGLIIVLSIVMVAQGVAARRRMLLAGQKEEIPYINIPRVLIFLVFIIAYVAFMDIVGYFIATAVFIVGTYLYLRAFTLRQSLLVALAFCALVYGVFVRLLYLPVPRGLLETILE